MLSAAVGLVLLLKVKSAAVGEEFLTDLFEHLMVQIQDFHSDP